MNTCSHCAFNYRLWPKAFFAVFFIMLSLLESYGFGLEVGTHAPVVILGGEGGGNVQTGRPWSSSAIGRLGKPVVLFYVDPDARTVNEKASDALKAAVHLDKKFISYAVVNMAATFIPNFLLSKTIEDSQTQYPSTIYLKDMNKTLVKKWGLKDDDSNIVVFDKSGKVIFSVGGKVPDDQLKAMISLLESAIK